MITCCMRSRRLWQNARRWRVLARSGLISPFLCSLTIWRTRRIGSITPYRIGFTSLVAMAVSCIGACLVPSASSSRSSNKRLSGIWQRQDEAQATKRRPPSLFVHRTVGFLGQAWEGDALLDTSLPSSPRSAPVIPTSGSCRARYPLLDYALALVAAWRAWCTRFCDPPRGEPRYCGREPAWRCGYHGEHEWMSPAWCSSLSYGAHCVGVVVWLAASPPLAQSGLEGLAARSAVVASGRVPQCRVGVDLASAPVGAAPAAAGARRHPAGATLCAVW